MAALSSSACAFVRSGRLVHVSRIARSVGRSTPQIRAMFGGKDGANPFGGGFMEKVKEAQERVQRETAQVQAELAATEFEGFDDDETVRVVFNGNQEPLAVDITQDAYDAGKEVRLGRSLRPRVSHEGV